MVGTFLWKLTSASEQQIDQYCKEECSSHLVLSQYAGSEKMRSWLCGSKTQSHPTPYRTHKVDPVSDSSIRDSGKDPDLHLISLEIKL